MDRLTKFYIHKSEVLAERLNALENELNYLKEDAPASVFKGTGAGQQAFSDSELEDQMRNFKKGGLFQKVEDENQTQEYKDAKAELDRRRAPKTNPDSSDSWIDRLNVPESEKGDLKAMRLGVIDKFNKGEEPMDSDAASITATGKRIQKEVENVPSVPDAITNAMMTGASKQKPQEKPKSEVVQGEDDFVAQERNKGVQSLVKKAFDDVGIGAAGINVEGPAAPREQKATSSDVQQFANRLLNPLANVPMAKGARSAKPKMGGMDATEFSANAAEAGGVYKKDKSGYLQSVYEPDSESPKAVADATGLPTASPTNVRPGTMGMEDMDGKPISVKPLEPAPAPDPAPIPTRTDMQKFANRLLNPLANMPMPTGARSPKPKMMEPQDNFSFDVQRGQFNLSQEDWETLYGKDTPYPLGDKKEPEPAPAPDPAPLKQKSQGIKVGKTVNDAVARFTGEVGPKVSEFVKKNLAQTTPNAMRERLYGTTDVPGAAPAPEPGPASAKDYLDRLLLRKEKTLSGEYLKNLKNAVTKKGGMRIINTSRPAAQPDYEMRAEDEFGLMGSKGDESPQFGMEIDADGNPRLMSPSEVAKDRERERSKKK